MWVIVSIRSSWFMKVVSRDRCYFNEGFVHKIQSILFLSCLKCGLLNYHSFECITKARWPYVQNVWPVKVGYEGRTDGHPISIDHQPLRFGKREGQRIQPFTPVHGSVEIEQLSKHPLSLKIFYFESISNIFSIFKNMVY